MKFARTLVRGIIGLLACLLVALLMQDRDPFAAAPRDAGNLPATSAAPASTAPQTTHDSPSWATGHVAAPAEATMTAVRVSVPTETAPQFDGVAAPTGLYGQPFAPPGLDACAEMNWYRVQAGLPEGWSDQPRTGPKRWWGLGWREGNCRNDRRTGCCFGYWQIAIANRTAHGYRSAGVFTSCGVHVASDFFGNEPIQKQKQACVAGNMYRYHTERGEDARWIAWDQWL